MQNSIKLNMFTKIFRINSCKKSNLIIVSLNTIKHNKVLCIVYFILNKVRYADKSTEILQVPTFIELKGFNFVDLKDRLEVFMFFVNALRFFYSCKQEGILPRTSPWVSTVETQRPNDKNMSIKIEGNKAGGATFIKKIKDWENLVSADPHSVEKIYDSIKKGKIRHSHKDLHFYLATNAFKIESKFCRSSCLEYISNARDLKKLLIHVSYLKFIVFV